MVRAALTIFLLLVLAAPRVWADAGVADRRGPSTSPSTSSRAESPESLQGIEDGMGRMSRVETVRLIEQWVEAHPNDPDVPKAVTWGAHLRLQFEDLAGARQAYRRAIAMGGVWSFRAYTALGDLEMSERQYTAAIAAYEGASRSPEETWAQLGQEGVIAARKARREAYTAIGLAVSLSLQTIILAIAAWRRRGRAAFWPLPWEIKFYFPFAAIMSLAASSLQAPKRGLIRTVCGGGLVIVAGYAIFFRTATLTPGKRVFASLLAIASAAALIYTAFVAFGLLGTIGAGGEGD